MDRTGWIRRRKAVPAYVLTWSVLLTLVFPCVVAMAQKLQKSLVDIFIIVGSEDKWTQISWIDRLRSTHLRLSIIEGANHFFDSAYEFDLQETVESIL